MEMDELRELLNKDDRFCRFNGMRLDVLRTGYAEAVMEIGGVKHAQAVLM